MSEWTFNAGFIGFGLLVVAILGWAIYEAGIDRGQCLKQHWQISGYMHDYGTDKSPIFIWQDTSGNVCDLWEYPNGKPKDHPGAK